MPSLLTVKLAVLASVLIAAFIWHQFEISAARQDGIRDERLTWQQRQAVAEARAREAQHEKQAEIASIEAEYWKRNASDREMIADLQEALDDEKQDNAVAAEPGRCAPPSVSKRVRDNLNRIGRD